jgi:hypothetical protein
MGWMENVAREGFGFEKKHLYFIVFNQNLNSNQI